MTLIAKVVISIVGKKAVERFDAATKSVAEGQERKLREILRRNAATEYGLKHIFGTIDTLAEYSRAVPVVTYEDIAALVKRMAAGESNVLTAEDPVMFSRTSGTTGEPKLIPVTPTCRAKTSPRASSPENTTRRHFSSGTTSSRCRCSKT